MSNGSGALVQRPDYGSAGSMTQRLLLQYAEDLKNRKVKDDSSKNS